MSQNVLLKASGKYTFPNRLSSMPEGALIKANNVVINRDNIVETRRGFKVYGDEIQTHGTAITDPTSASVSYTAHQLVNYKERLLRHFGSGSGQYLEWDNGTGTFTKFFITFSADIHESTTIDNLTSTAELSVGMQVIGSTAHPDDIAGGTFITEIVDNTSIVISSATTATRSTTDLRFIYTVQEVEAGLRIKSIEQNGNLYFTTNEGIKKISSSDATFTDERITQAGGVKALDISSSLDTGANWFTTDSVVGYRAVWGIDDANDNLILGTPSERVVQRNSSGSTKVVDIRITIPKSITTNHFFQIYRTATFPDPTAVQDPGDEMGLVYEANPTSMDLDNGYVVVEDITPDSLRGANLYTNANSGEGILQANDLPPLAKDLTTYKNYTFFANTKTRQRLNLSLLSAEGISDGDTITIFGGQTYTFKKAGEDISSREIALYNSGVSTSPPSADNSSGSVSVDVDLVARSMARVLNGQSDEILYAYYISGPDDIPGAMLLEARGLNQVAFYLTGVFANSSAAHFNPEISASTTSAVSADEESPNRIYYSKAQQPEAVPILNYIDVGPKDKEIIRILALRDSLFIFKEEGVYRLSGSSAPFQVYPFDFSTNLKGPDSAVVLNNLIYMFSNQGVATVSDNQVGVISRPIEGELRTLPDFSNFSTATFGVPYESDRAYYLFLPTASTDTHATQCFRYNTFTNSWTTLNLEKRCGLVNVGNDLLYLGATDVAYLEKERKAFDRTDIADREYAFDLGIDSVDDKTIYISTVGNISDGDVFVQTQYLTLKEFNRLLERLDSDAMLTDGNYVSTLTLSPGGSVFDGLTNVVAKVAADAGRIAQPGATSGATYLALSFTSDFEDTQDGFNDFITLLNNDTGVQQNNFLESGGTTNYEFAITNVDTNSNSFTSPYSYPIVQGPITIYNHISSEIQFAPQFFGDVSMTKQVSEGTILFEDSSFTEGTLSYSSDLSGDDEDILVSGSGSGLFGTIIFGNGIYGGSGSAVPFRTYIPRNKQRCRFLNVSFSHAIAREVYSLYGLSLTFEPKSNRGWR